MTETSDWTEWRESWQAEASSFPSGDDLARFHRARRRDLTVRIAEWAIVVLAVVFPIAAISHAANIAEATLGIGAAIIVVAAAVFRSWNRGVERRMLAENARVFDDTARRLCLAERRFVRFLWLVLAAEGGFAAFWWYGGLGLHHRLLSPIALAALWLPLTCLIAILAWSIHLGVGARRELAALDAREALTRQLDASLPRPRWPDSLRSE